MMSRATVLSLLWASWVGRKGSESERPGWKALGVNLYRDALQCGCCRERGERE